MIVQAAQRARGMAREAGARVLISSDHRAIVGSAALIAVLTLLAKAVTLGRDMVVASRFGTGDVNDAYLAAWALPGFFVGVVSGGLVGALMPVQLEVRTKRGPERERAVVGETLLISLALYVATALFLLAGRDWLTRIITSGYGDAKFELAVQLSLIMLPAAVIGGLATTWSALLNAENRFGLVAAAPMAVPAASLVLLLAVPNASIEWLAAGFVIGTGLQAAVLYLGIAREGLTVAFGWHGLLPETRQVLRQFLALALNNVIFNGFIVVDTAMAATLGPGSQSTMNYANKLMVPLLAVSSTALGTVVLPYFSRLVASEDWTGLRHAVRTYVRLIVAGTVPLTVGMILFARPFVGLLFERGEFTPDDTRRVAAVLATYALLLPVETTGVLMSRVVMSFQLGKLMVLTAVLVFAVNVVGDYVLKGLIGVQGIALATVINQSISLGCLLLMWRHIQRTRMA